MTEVVLVYRRAMAYRAASSALRWLLSRGDPLSRFDADDLRYCAGCVIGYQSGPTQAAHGGTS